MKYRYDPSVRSFQQPAGGHGQAPHNQSPFPGISDPFVGLGKSGGMQAPLPYDPAEFSTGVPTINIMPAGMQEVTPLPEMVTEAPAATAVAKTDTKGGFNLGNSLSDLKGVVDRMGGLDGIVTTMTKVQKVVGSITQMAPLIKVLAGSLGKKGAGAAALADDDIDEYKPRPRKKKRRRPVKGKAYTPIGVKPQRPRRK